MDYVAVMKYIAENNYKYTFKPCYQLIFFSFFQAKSINIDKTKPLPCDDPYTCLGFFCENFQPAFIT